MNKYLLSLLLFSSSAFAVDLYHYSPIEGCSLRKATGGSWQVVPPSDVGQDAFPIQVSKANAAYSNFKYQGSWYAAKTECFKMSDAVTASNESHEGVGANTPFHLTKGKFFVEPKLSFYIMTGSGTASGTLPGVSVEKYSPSIGIAAKVGYYLNDHSDVFFELNRFAGSRNADWGVGNVKTEDSVMSFNLGYQYFLSKFGKLLPYGELALGINSLSQKQTSGAGTIEYTGSGIGVIVEGGVLYDLSAHIALLGALNYTIMNFSQVTQKGTSTQLSNSMGYSHFGINLGARYNF